MVDKVYKLLIYILLIVFFTSCISISEKRQKSVQYIADVWQAENVNIEQITHGNGSQEVILSLYNLNAVDTSYSNQKITSSTALSFIRELNNKEIENISTVKIAVDNKGKKFEKVFWKDSLVLALNLLPITDKFFDYGIDSNYNAFRNLFDLKSVNDSLVRLGFNFFETEQLFNVGTDNRIVEGINTVKINEENILAVAERIEFKGEYYSNFIFLIDFESKKIVDFSIN